MSDLFREWWDGRFPEHSFSGCADADDLDEAWHDGFETGHDEGLRLAIEILQAQL
jgi:hypothetical protein